MTPQEKAKELIQKFRPHSFNVEIDEYGIITTDIDTKIEEAKINALICVDEIINVILDIEDVLNQRFGNLSQADFTAWHREVKKEIEKL